MESVRTEQLTPDELATIRERNRRVLALLGDEPLEGTRDYDIRALLAHIDAKERAHVEYEELLVQRAERAEAHIDALRAVILTEHDRLRDAHGESCDCDECLTVQRLADSVV